MLNILFGIIAVFVVISIISGINNNKKMPDAMPEPMIGHGDFDLTILEVENSKKIDALKEIRVITGYELKSVKDIIDNVPFKLMQNVQKEYAEEVKTRLTGCGVTANITEAEIRM